MPQRPTAGLPCVGETCGRGLCCGQETATQQGGQEIATQRGDRNTAGENVTQQGENVTQQGENVTQQGDTGFAKGLDMERYRIHRDGAVYYVTYSIVEWLPVFVSVKACKIVTDSLTFCHREKQLRVLAFVVMPTHFHAVVFDEQFNSERLAETLTAFRKFTGRQIVSHCRDHAPACFVSTFREASGNDREHRVWQPTRHPVVVATEAFCQQKVDYMHENPYRKGLVRRAVDWRYSSASYWLSDGTTANDVPLTPILW